MGGYHDTTMDNDDKEDLEQIDENTRRIYAYLKTLYSGVLFIAWCFIAANTTSITA